MILIVLEVLTTRAHIETKINVGEGLIWQKPKTAGPKLKPKVK